MAKRVQVRLIGEEETWRSLPDDWEFNRLEHVPTDGWVDLGDGRWCRASAIIEAHVVEVLDAPEVEELEGAQATT
jgi:hypothetical protein